MSSNYGNSRWVEAGLRYHFPQDFSGDTASIADHSKGRQPSPTLRHFLGNMIIGAPKRKILSNRCTPDRTALPDTDRSINVAQTSRVNRGTPFRESAETNVVFSSGPVDVSDFAGETNELLEGTSTNAPLTVENLVFSVPSQPALQAQASNGNLFLPRLMTAQRFSL